MPNNNLKQLIENTIKSEVKKNSFIPVIWNSDLEVTPFATELGKKYATIINRRTVRLINYEFASNEENEIKIISIEELPPSLTKEQALEKAKKIESEIKEQDKLISIEQEEELWQTVQLTAQEQIPIITEQTDNLKIQQEIDKLGNDNKALKKENEELNKKLIVSANITKILNLEDKLESKEVNFFNTKFKIYDVLIKNGIWKDRALTPEKMEAAIKSLSSNLDGLRNELVQEEKQFEEFSSQLEQTKQRPQSQILQQTNLPYSTSSSSK